MNKWVVRIKPSHHFQITTLQPEKQFFVFSVDSASLQPAIYAILDDNISIIANHHQLLTLRFSSLFSGICKETTLQLFTRQIL